MREITERAFKVYGEPIKNVSAFTYLGIVLTTNDDNWPGVVRNLGKARSSCGRLSQVLVREKEDPKVLRAFYICGVKTQVSAPKSRTA